MNLIRDREINTSSGASTFGRNIILVPQKPYYMVHLKKVYLPKVDAPTSSTSSSKVYLPKVDAPQGFQSSRAFHSSSIITQPIKELRYSQKQKFIGVSTEFTEFYEPSDDLYSKIEAIFWTAKGELFEDGMETPFSHQLNSFVQKYSNDGLDAIVCLIVYEKVDPEVAGEALRWLGRIDHRESYEFRRWLLERSLSLSSTRVRDGAILGLASMDDKHAIPYLKDAIKKEQCSELKSDMESVLEQLEI